MLPIQQQTNLNNTSERSLDKKSLYEGKNLYQEYNV